MLKASLIFVLLALTNASFLYFHQFNSDYWLPKTEPGKWRQGATQAWRRNYAQSEAVELGYANYNDMPDEKRKTVDARVDEKYPPEWMLKIERRNSFRDYVSTFGMWQWPITLIATIFSFIVLLRHRRYHVWMTIPACTIAIALHVDAWYRSYFEALGW